MNNINIRIAQTEDDIQDFLDLLDTYFVRDIHSEPDEHQDYFTSLEYVHTILSLRDRKQDPLHFLFFERNGEIIGFALAVIYNNEDGKCFILEFCVLPEFRGSGTGTACAGVLMGWAKEKGALYFELNAGREDRRRFWSRLGFAPNGMDEWGEPLMLLPPAEDAPLEVAPPWEADLWQVYHLENSYRREIGEEPLTDEDKEAIEEAVSEGKITFLCVRRKTRHVGMCSISVLPFSTFQCRPIAVFEDFYVEPHWRKKGAADMLARAAQDWCSARSISTLWVGSAPCDRELYRALGFDVELGSLLAWNDNDT